MKWFAKPTKPFKPGHPVLDAVADLKKVMLSTIDTLRGDIENAIINLERHFVTIVALRFKEIDDRLAAIETKLDALAIDPTALATVATATQDLIDHTARLRAALEPKVNPRA